MSESRATAPLRVDAASARRRALDAALLRGPRLTADADGILAVARHLGGIQLDPTRTVEKTHFLVLWSRLGSFDRQALDRLLAGRRLIELNAFIVPIERLPVLRYQAVRWATGSGAWQRRVRDFLAANDAFRRSILDQLRAEGPLPSRAIDAGKLAAGWQSGGWTHGRNVTRMLEFMGVRMEIMVAGRQGQERLWDLAERVLPRDAPTRELTEPEYAELRVGEAMDRFGIATLREIAGRIAYVSAAGVRATLDRMVADGQLEPVGLRIADATVAAFASSGALERAAAPGESRTTLLSPFDPLIYNRDRTERLFGFRYRLEMYVPKEQREYGHFALPIVHEDRLVGRADPAMDRRSRKLVVNAIHWQPDQPQAGVMDAVGAAMLDLAAFIGADEVSYR